MAENNSLHHFDISASVIRQLGEELVTDEVTAIMELIKNAYDADADWVKVEINLIDSFSDPNKYYTDSSNGYISIEDNGFGMSDEDIWKRWMKISLSFKKKFKDEGSVTPKGRTPLGEKGVGRLSSQKLGSRLELFTSKEGLENRYHVAFDWDNFDDDTSLTSVPVHLSYYPKEKREKGTLLLITNLKESNKWTGQSWDRFRGQISQMIFPFREKRVFNVYLKLNGQSIDLDEINKNVRDNSVSTYNFSLKGNKVFIKGAIKLRKLNGSNNREHQTFYESKILPDLGKDFFSFLVDSDNNKKNFISNITYSEDPKDFILFEREIPFDKMSNLSYYQTELDNIQGQQQQISLAHPGNFEGEINDFFFRETEEIESIFDSLSEFKRIVQNQIGVRIFRDGFGIKPYGIDKQDWMGLSSNQTSGGSFYGLRPGNIIGYVSISAKENRVLSEKTDREGFTDSPHSKNFFRIMDYFVTEINSVLEKTRRSFGDYRGKLKGESLGIRTMSDSFVMMKASSDNAQRNSEKVKAVSQKFQEISERVSTLDPDSQNPNNKGNPEIDSIIKYLRKVLDEAEQLLTQISSILIDTKKIGEHVEFLQPQIQNLERQLSDFSELAALGLTAESLSHEISNVVTRIVQETDKTYKNLKVAVDQKQVLLYVEYINSAIRSIKKQLSHLDPSLRYVRELKENITVEIFLKEIVGYFQDRFKEDTKIQMKLDGNNSNLLINRGKLTQVIDNIIINSEYWLKEKKKGDLSFNPEIYIEFKEPFLRIFDNGDGVDPNLQDQIFQPFISGKPKNQGRGLGLFIVQQLLESVGCEITLLHSKNSYGRRYVFQINLSNVLKN